MSARCRAERRQRGKVGQAAVDVDLVLARCRKHPADDQVLAGLHLDPLLAEQVLDLFRCAAVQLERRFHDRFLAARPDQVRAGTLAERKVQGIDDDGLARAGLAGEHVQPRGEFHAELVDDGKILYVQFF